MSLPHRASRPLLLLICAICVALDGINLVGTAAEAVAQPALPTFPGMGLYSDVAKDICGKEGLTGTRWNPNELPWIGCFGLSGERSSSGVIAGHRLEVGVNSQGEDVCKIDGAAASCQGCIDKDGDCSAMLTVISRNKDKSVFFHFSQKVSHNVYVTNQENWEDFKKPEVRCRYANC
jgi:hypothetical protein